MKALRTRLIIALVAVLGLGGVFVLPTSFDIAEAAVNQVFPPDVGEWTGVAREIGEREKAVLDQNTNFEKRFYWRESPHHLLGSDTIDATMVLSGDDMNNSIHRPERCLKAQGFQDILPSTVAVDIGDGQTLEVKRLHFVREFADGTRIPAIMYYWFVGADYITHDHYARTLYDIRYRLFRGTNQSWAYVSLQSSYGDDLAPGYAQNTEEQTDAFMQDFIRRTFFSLHKTERIRGWKDVQPPQADVAAAAR